MRKAQIESPSQRVRHYVCREYLSPARMRGDRTVSVNVGTVHRAVRLENRVPLVCTALESQKFQKENGLRLISKTGPPSGQSTTVTFTYELLDNGARNANHMEAWLKLRGIAKDIFASLGGGEAFVREQRENFYAPGTDPLAHSKGRDGAEE